MQRGIAALRAALRGRGGRMVLGGVLYYLKRLPGFLYDFVERFFILKIEILDDDEINQSPITQVLSYVGSLIPWQVKKTSTIGDTATLEQQFAKLYIPDVKSLFLVAWSYRHQVNMNL